MLKDKIGKNSIYFKKKPKQTRVNQETRDASFTRIILKFFWKTQSRIKTMLKDKIGKNSIYLKKKKPKRTRVNQETRDASHTCYRIQ
jgi:hypothetical protein